MQQVENELDQVQEQLSLANTKLEEKEKALQNVSRDAVRCCRRCWNSTLIHALFFLFFSFLCANYVGRGGGSQPSEEDATT